MKEHDKRPAPVLLAVLIDLLVTQSIRMQSELIE